MFHPPAPAEPTASPLRFGILGAARIAPIALVLPVKGHPDAVVAAVAARDQGRADAFAKKHGIPKAYGGPGSYQRMSLTILLTYPITRVSNHELQSCWMTLKLTSCIIQYVIALPSRAFVTYDVYGTSYQMASITNGR